MSHHHLSTDERNRFDENGFLIRQGVLSSSEIAILRAAAGRTATMAAAAAAQGQSYVLDGNRFVDAQGATIQFEHSCGSGQVRVIEPAHVFDPRWEELLSDGRLVQPMGDLVGSERVALWTDKLNLKPARQGSGFRWHQDSPYWMHDCAHVDRLPNVMVALDDADADNGCLRIIRGSHSNGMLPGTADGTQLGGFFTDPACFNEADQVLLAVPAGSLVFFSPHAVHGSGPNRSGGDRRAWIATYQPADQPMLKAPRVRNLN